MQCIGMDNLGDDIIRSNVGGEELRPLTDLSRDAGKGDSTQYSTSRLPEMRVYVCARVSSPSSGD